MESALQSLEEKQEVLVSELEQAHSRLAMLENAQTHVSDRERDLDRQREILQQSVGSETQGMSHLSRTFKSLIFTPSTHL